MSPLASFGLRVGVGGVAAGLAYRFVPTGAGKTERRLAAGVAGLAAFNVTRLIQEAVDVVTAPQIPPPQPSTSK